MRSCDWFGRHIFMPLNKYAAPHMYTNDQLIFFVIIHDWFVGILYCHTTRNLCPPRLRGHLPLHPHLGPRRLLLLLRQVHDLLIELRSLQDRVHSREANLQLELGWLSLVWTEEGLWYGMLELYQLHLPIQPYNADRPNRHESIKIQEPIS